MPGECGKQVPGQPGYMGFIPSFTMGDIVVKTPVSQPMPFSKRVGPNVTHSTVDELARTLPDTSKPCIDPSKQRNFFLPKRHVGESEQTLLASVRSMKDMPSRAHMKKGDLFETPKFNATATSFDASKTMGQPSKTFMSMVRKTEQANAEEAAKQYVVPSRSSAKAAFPSTLCLQRRKEDKIFVPEPIGFHKQERRTLNGVPPLTASDIVKFHHPPQKTSYQKEIGTGAPTDHIPSCGSEMSLRATTKEMFAGTPKSTSIIPGYMGHVPTEPRNIGTMKLQADPQRAHVKANIFMSAPSSAVPGYTGFKPKTVENDRAGGFRPPLEATTAGRTAMQIMEGGKEKGVNEIGKGKTCAVRGFFTASGLQADNIIADQFCVRFRPLEGVMKHGSKDSQRWIPDKDLFKTYQVAN